MRNIRSMCIAGDRTGVCVFQFLSFRLLAVAVALLAGITGVKARAQVPMVTQHSDIARSGANTSETTLTTGNVNTSTFGKLFTESVDGQVYAQPLYLPNVQVTGKGAHNVVYIATENDSVYAFDGDSSGSALWQANLASSSHGAGSGATAVPEADVNSTDISPKYGITGTPVIDPNTGTLYVVSFTLEGSSSSDSSYILRLHALDVTNGSEKMGGPIKIKASVSGTGNGSSGGTLAFDAKAENQRGGLLLLNGVLYIPFGSHGDKGPWHGWILSYNASNLHPIGAFCTTPNGVGGGIWMGGNGVAGEVNDPGGHPYGRMFFTTANGDYTATKPYSNGMDFGDTVMNMDLTNGVPTVTDEFTPFNQASLDAIDGDLGSGGALIVPGDELVQIGKEATIYLMNRENLGGYNSGSDNVVQEIANGSSGNGSTKSEWGDGLWGGPAYWNNNVYIGGSGDTINTAGGPIKTFSLSGGRLSTSPTSQSSHKYFYTGTTPTISSNGTSNGILWSLEPINYGQNPGVVWAYDANDLSTVLYNSNMKSGDGPGIILKMAIPTVANGKVYMGGAGAPYSGGTGMFAVYGLLGGTPKAATPVLNPATETFQNSVSVSISDSTQNSTIYYTTDGSTPNTGSNVYSGSINVTSTETIKAIATAPGYLQSAVASETYTKGSTPPAATPVISPGSESFQTSVSVTITDSTQNSTIYYTTDGSTPNTGSNIYSGAITVTSTETIEAIATASGFVQSNVATAVYTQGSGNLPNYPSGFTSTGLTFNGGSIQGTTLQIVDGGANETHTIYFTDQVNVQNFTNDFDFKILQPNGGGFTFIIQNQGLNAVGIAGGSGLGSHGINNSVAIKFDIFNNSGEGNDSTGVYLDGASPTVPAVDITPSGIELNSGDVLHAHMVYDGTNLTLTITDSSSGKTFSHVFGVNIPSTVGGNNAYVGFTSATGTSTSIDDILDWTYSTSVTPTTATPVISPGSESFQNSVSVTITDSTQNSTIYYTTDGSTPNTGSAMYSGAINVTSTETIKAIATASGLQQSNVATAVYTLSSGGGGSLPNYPTGFTSAGLTFNGGSIQGTTLQLVDGGANETHTIYFSTAVAVTTFTTDFDFQILNPAGGGFTFILQNQGLNAVGLAGGSGLGSHNINSSVAIKFDIFNNAGEGNDSTGVYLDGASPTVPAVDITPSGIELNSGDELHAHMVYDGTNLTLTITDSSTGDTFTHTFAVNIPQTVGGNTAFVGFTSATGGSTSIDDVLDWTYTTP